MKKILFISLLFFFLSTSIAVADCTSETMQSHWIECMDYDGASPPSGWPTCGGASWQDWQVMNWDCSNPDYFNPLPGDTALSTSIKYSGTRSLMLVKQAGCHAATQTWYDWSVSHPGVTKLHVRMYVYFDSSWTSFSGDPDNYWHFFLLNAGAWTPGMDIGDVTDEKPWNIICNAGDNGQYLRYRHLSNSDELYMVGPATAGECWNIEANTNAWHAHEFMFERHSATEYHYKHWVDEVLHADRVLTNANIRDVGTWTNLHLDQWLSTGAGVAQEVKTYVDNVVIATDYIGPMASGPTITNITSSTTNGTWGTGTEIPITVTFSEAVTSTGNVTLTTNTAPTRTCTFTVTAETSKSCTYTVQATDTVADLDVTVSGTIKNAAEEAMTNFTPATSLATNKALVIDTTAPVRTNSGPSGQLNCPADPTTKTIYITTGEASTCKMHTSDVAYASMATTFGTTGGTSHSHNLTGLACGASYTRYVRCTDGSDPSNANGTSTQIDFSIASLEASEKQIVNIGGGGTRTMTIGGGGQSISW